MSRANSAARPRWATAVAAALVGVSAAATTFEVVVVRPRIRPLLDAPDELEHWLLTGVFYAFLVSGALVVARRPRHPTGWVLAAIGFLVTVSAPLAAWGEYRMVTVGAPDLATTVGLWFNSWYWLVMLSLLTFYLPVLFPDGRLPTRRWRPVFWLVTGCVAILAALGMLQPTLSGQDLDDVSVANPIGIAGAPHPETSLLGTVLFGSVMVGMLASIVSLVVRFRRSRGVERQQLKWFLFAVSLLPLLPFGELLETALSGVAPEGTGRFLFPLVISALPVGVGVAVLRHKLWDIDRIISRTFGYVLVVAVLAGLYLGAVLGLGAAARGLTGDTSDLVVALSTLAVAAAFQPVRRRVQALVDRRFNRSRVDAARTVEAFGRTLRDEVSLDAVVTGLRDTTAGTFQPRHVGLVLTPRGNT
jgi:hypothetical protein